MVTSTRSQSNSPVKKKGLQQPLTAAMQQCNPLKHFILPRKLSPNARFILLRSPRSSTRERFLFCPEQGLFQFTKIHAPSADPRSLLFTHAGQEANPDEQNLSKGYISKSADFFVATPFDLAFMLFALVSPTTSKSSKGLFQPLDDILEQHIQEDKQLRYLFTHGRHFIDHAMASFCDAIDDGEAPMYRPSEEKALQMIMQKVDAAINNGLPASLEDKFVKRKLEMPVLSVKREESTTRSQVEIPVQDEGDTLGESFESQSTAASTAASVIFSEVSAITSATTVVSDGVPEELLELQKRSVVLEFVLESYLPASVAERLKARFSAPGAPIDFAPLEQHLRTISTLKAEAALARSIGDFSRKRGLEDDDATELREGKKRRQEEEERKKKAGESRGVRDLKKVNVAGMKKMSDFFTKKPTAKVK